MRVEAALRGLRVPVAEDGFLLASAIERAHGGESGTTPGCTPIQRGNPAVQILEYGEPRHPEARGRCVAHPHVFGRQLGVIFYEATEDQEPTIAQAAEAVATGYLQFIPGRAPEEVLWFQAWPPETCRRGARGEFSVTRVAYRWLDGQARCPVWSSVELALAETVRHLWYKPDGPAFAAAVVSSWYRQRQRPRAPS